MNSPFLYKSFQDEYEIIITTTVLKELDKHKNNNGEIGKNIRDFANLFEENSHLFKTIDSTQYEQSLDNYDQAIIQIAVDEDASLCTSDLLMGHIARTRKVPIIRPLEVAKRSIDNKYTGFSDSRENLFPNEFFRKDGRISRMYNKEVKSIGKDLNFNGITHRNLEQRMAMELLNDKKINLVTLEGIAGCGKTLLAIAAGIQHVTNNEYNNVLIARPTVSMGKEIGFLPGDLNDKLKPWLMPIYDNLSIVMPDNTSEALEETGVLKIESLSMIRGRSIPNQFIIIDEAQNLTPHEIKTIITRVGEGSKIIFTGDTHQIDNKECDSINNGLTYIINAFRPYNISGHVTLQKSERSELASLACKILK